MENRRGDWIETYSGRMFWPLDPRPEEVVPRDVAHHLALICRYNGACDFHYSVAQHSVLLSDWCEANMDPHSARVALLHDGAEAYMADVVRPTKHEPRIAKVLGPVEKALQQVVYEHFGIRGFSGKPHWMAGLEVRMAVTERAALMPHGRANHWGFTDGVDPLPVAIRQWRPSDAEVEFRLRVRRLFPGIAMDNDRA